MLSCIHFIVESDLHFYLSRVHDFQGLEEKLDFPVGYGDLRTIVEVRLEERVFSSFCLVEVAIELDFQELLKLALVEDSALKPRHIEDENEPSEIGPREEFMADFSHVELLVCGNQIIDLGVLSVLMVNQVEIHKVGRFAA